MAADGITIGQSSAGVDKKQQVLAHLPFLMAPDRSLKNVLSIGLGTGILVAEAAKHPGVDEVEVVEISPSIVAGSRHFGAYNGGIPNPKVRVIGDDGVLYLRHAAKRYEAIVADGKSRSGHAGNAVFYSEDFYRAALEHLAPAGMFVQWVPLDVAPDELRIIVRTFIRSFPHSYVWLGQESCFLVGQTEPLRVDVSHVQDVLSRPATADLARYGWTRAEEAVAMLVGDKNSVSGWIAGGTEVNSLERPVLEFFSLSDTVAREHDRVAANLAALADVRDLPLSDVEVIGGRAEELARSRGAVAAALDGLVALNRDQATAAAYLHRAADASPPGGIVRHIAAEALFEVGRALDLDGHPESAVAWYGEAVGVWPGFVEARINTAKIEARRGLRSEAEHELELALSQNPLSGPAHRLLGELQGARGDGAEAVVHLRRAARLAPRDAEAHESLGLAFTQTGSMSDALAEFQEAIHLRPDWGAALGRVALLLAVGPDPAARRPGEAVRLARRAVEQDPTDGSLFEVLAASCAANGDFDEAATAERVVLRMALAAGDQPAAGAARDAIGRYERRLPPAPIRATAAP
jgi:spermidine synthase